MNDRYDPNNDPQWQWQQPQNGQELPEQRGLKNAGNMPDNQYYQPVPPDIPAYNAPNSGGNGGSGKGFILTVIIAVLLAVISFLGFIFIKKMNKNGDDTAPVSTTETTEDEPIEETEAVTTAEKTTTTTASTTAVQTTETTQKPTLPLPEITAEIEKVSDYPQQGSTWYLNVSGNFASYYYEVFSAYAPDWNYNLKTTGTTSNARIALESASVGVGFRVNITPYNSDGAAGKTVTALYDPIQPGSQEGVITKCTKYGQINVPTGGPINGYAKSFIIDGGQMACVRHDLMDKWHVTAVNYYIKNGVTWYELYDTDDGDYYGWLDEAHITFY